MSPIRLPYLIFSRSFHSSLPPQSISSLNEILLTPSDNPEGECSRSVFYFGSTPNQHSLAALEWAIHNLPYGTRLFLVRDENLEGDHDDQWKYLMWETAKFHGAVWVQEAVLSKQTVADAASDSSLASRWANETARLINSSLADGGERTRVGLCTLVLSSVVL